MITIDSLFVVEKGHQLALNDVDQTNAGGEAVAYVARSHRNNGVTAWVKAIDGLEPSDAGNITVCLRSRNHALSAFVQPRKFYTTYHVAVLKPRQEMTTPEKLWWCLCIKANRFRFNFGRQANRTIGSLLVPKTVPSWVFAVSIPSFQRSALRETNVPVDVSMWQRFLLSDLFSLNAGQYTTRRDLKLGTTPLVSASALNNGITAKVEVEPDWNGGQITVANNGSVGAAFYQPRPFSASRDVTVLDPKMPLAAAESLFICAMIRKESLRFNYARKWNQRRMLETTILLPAKSSKEPDFAAMRAIMANLRLGWVLEQEQPKAKIEDQD